MKQSAIDHLAAAEPARDARGPTGHRGIGAIASILLAVGCSHDRGADAPPADAASIGAKCERPPPLDGDAGAGDVVRPTERYRVYSPHLEVHWIEGRGLDQLMVLDRTTAYPLRQAGSGAESNLRSLVSDLGLDETAVVDLFDANEAEIILENRFTVSVPVDIVPADEPPGGSRYHMLTEVGFSTDGRDAVFCEVDICGDLCGEANCSILTRDAEGGWCVVEVVLLWVS